MKMAKASEKDIETSLEICRALESLANGYLPDEMTAVDDDNSICYDDEYHSADVVEYLIKLTKKASIFRVCFGMAVLLDPQNEIVDPDSDVLELHPSIKPKKQEEDTHL